jgi:predicted small lipoprotein YifL
VKRLVPVLLLCLALALAGCGPKVPAANKAAADQKAACLATQVRIEQTMKLFYADSGTYPPIEIVLAKLQATCPAGGTYTFSETTEKTTCSIHGSP